MQETTTAIGGGNGQSPAAAGASTAGGGGAPEARFPMFYRAPRPLDSRRHAGKRLRAVTDLGFARATNAMPLNGIEFLLAVKHYPIVFTASDPAAAVAVVGLRERENLYLRSDGSWEPGAYVPAYVRRYPFIFLEDRERGQFVLCIDEAAEALSEVEGELLFDGDQPGPAGTRARDFCTAFQGQNQATRAFADAVAATGLLVENRAQIVLKDGRAMGVAGFRVIDEAKFNALPDETILDWRRKGWLPLVYCHLISASNWANLVDRAAADPAGSAA
ncbi:MAG TPA: SapC family protein [Alphaproteobacteria bacterium]|nr:SapC family protein [Alphaproteobacteria bacterium]